MKPHDWVIGSRRFEGTRRLHFQGLRGPRRTYRTSWISTVKLLVHSKRRESKTKWCGVISQNHGVFKFKDRMFIQYLPTTCYQTSHYSISVLFHLYKNKITGWKGFHIMLFRAPVYQESRKEYKQMKILNPDFVCSQKTENSREGSTFCASASFLIPRLVVAKRAPNGIYPYAQLYLEEILKS